MELLNTDYASSAVVPFSGQVSGGTFGVDLSSEAIINDATGLELDAQWEKANIIFHPTLTLYLDLTFKLVSMNNSAGTHTLAYVMGYKAGDSDCLTAKIHLYQAWADPARRIKADILNDAGGTVKTLNMGQDVSIGTWYRVRLHVNAVTGAATMMLYHDVADTWTLLALDNDSGLTIGTIPYIALMPMLNTASDTVQYADPLVRNDASFASVPGDTDAPGVWDAELYDYDAATRTGKLMVITDRDADATVEYSVDGSPPAYGSSATLLSKSASGRIHRFQFTGLLPATTYAYRVKVDDGVLSEVTVGDASNLWGDFASAWTLVTPDPDGFLSFVAGCDTQSWAWQGGWITTQAAQACMDDNDYIGRPIVTVLPGDWHWIDSGRVATREADKLLSCMSDWVATIYVTATSWVVACNGNHDDPDGASAAFSDMTVMPPAPSGYDNYRLGNTEFFVLNFPYGDITDEQLSWLASAAGSSDAPNKILIHHYQLLGTPDNPPSPGGPESNAGDLLDACVTAGIKLVMHGQTHRFADVLYEDGSGNQVRLLNVPRFAFAGAGDDYGGYTVSGADAKGMTKTAVAAPFTGQTYGCARGYTHLIASKSGMSWKVFIYNTIYTTAVKIYKSRGYVRN